jgi:hypothetical protein
MSELGNAGDMEQVRHIQPTCQEMLHQDRHGPLCENIAVHHLIEKGYHCHDLTAVAIREVFQHCKDHT